MSRGKRIHSCLNMLLGIILYIHVHVCIFVFSCCYFEIHLLPANHASVVFYSNGHFSSAFHLSLTVGSYFSPGAEFKILRSALL